MVMMAKLAFKPKIRYYELEYYLDKFKEKEVKNTRIYELVKTLVNKAEPSHRDRYDKRWDGFYLPLKRSGRLIATPVWIMEYRKEFFIRLHLLGGIHVRRGKEKAEDFYKTLFSEVLRFIPAIKTNEKILERLVPYDIRTGKIKGQYVLEKLFPKNEKEKLLETYAEHTAKNMDTGEISLEEYLNVAAICYRAAFPEESKGLTPPEMYKKWADGRDGGMFSIKDWTSKTAFAEWLKSGRHVGSHPFEIVFSWHGHGIHLYPPHDKHYGLYVTNYAYAPKFIKMVEALTKEGIPFEADELKNVLDFLAGETYFAVNEYEEHRFGYVPSKEYKQKYFPHIEWDAIRTPKWKKRSGIMH